MEKYNFTKIGSWFHFLISRLEYLLKTRTWTIIRSLDANSFKLNTIASCYSVQLKTIFKAFWRFFSSKFGFGLVRFSCIPSFNLLLCRELVKKFSVVGGGGWMKATLVFIKEGGRGVIIGKQMYYIFLCFRACRSF